MWETLKYKFEKYPARMNVANKMVELGLHIGEDQKIYCGNLKIGTSSLAKAANVERKAIKPTIDFILDDEELSTIFKNILPGGTLLKNIAKNLGLGALEIETSYENTGMLSTVSELISKANIDIRQAYASDTDLEKNPTLTIITEKPIPSNMIPRFLKIKGIKRVSLY